MLLIEEWLEENPDAFLIFAADNPDNEDENDLCYNIASEEEIDQLADTIKQEFMEQTGTVYGKFFNGTSLN